MKTINTIFVPDKGTKRERVAWDENDWHARELYERKV